MSEISPLRNFSGIVLIGLGAMSVMSAVIGTISAYVLIEPSDREAVGITPGDFLASYLVMALVGAGLIYFGFRLRKPRPPHAS